MLYGRRSAVEDVLLFSLEEGLLWKKVCCLLWKKVCYMEEGLLFVLEEDLLFSLGIRFAMEEVCCGRKSQQQMCRNVRKRTFGHLRPLLISSQSDYLIRVFDRNSHF